MPASVAAAALLAAAPLSAQNAKESFTGFAINMNSGPKTAVVDFTIARWSTDAEREQLLAILQEEKESHRANDKPLKALQKMPKVDYIRTANTLSPTVTIVAGTLQKAGLKLIPFTRADARHQARSKVSVTTSTITTSSLSVCPSGAVQNPFAGDRRYAVRPLNRSVSSRRV